MTAPVIRPLDLAEAETLVGWAKAEGWNPGLADAAAFHAADPAGFIGCFVDGRLAAGISAVRYGTDFGFIGLYIAHPDFRGQGHGHRVWNAGMAHLAGRTVGLDGVPEQRENYRSMGFIADYDTFRWSGKLAGRSDARVVPADPSLIAAVIRLDRQHFPCERETFLRKWLEPPRMAKAVIRDGAMKAYAVFRQCHEGFKIGPLFAGDAADAMMLVETFAAEAPDQTMHIDVPAAQTAMVEFLRNAGFCIGFQTTRMYRGEVPRFDLGGVFGVTTLELG